MADLEKWDDYNAEKSGVTTEELDRLGKRYDALYSKYEQLKREASNALKAAEEAESALIDSMERGGKSKYHIEGLGTYSFTERMSVTTPKTIADKQALAQYLKDKGGDEEFWAKFSVNSQSLNAMYRADYEEFQAKCQREGTPEKIAEFKVPGLDAPTALRSLRFNKERG